jgi:hypothetical protein
MSDEDTNPLSDLKHSKNGAKIMNVSDRASLIMGDSHASNALKSRETLETFNSKVPELYQKSSTEFGNIYLGVRCKPGISMMNFLLIPAIPFLSILVL